MPDVGNEVNDISVGDYNSFTLPATGTASQRRFILATKDPFTITATVNTGYLVLYVGLYPDSILEDFQWKAEGDEELSINVKQTD